MASPISRLGVPSYLRNGPRAQDLPGAMTGCRCQESLRRKRRLRIRLMARLCCPQSAKGRQSDSYALHDSDCSVGRLQFLGEVPVPRYTDGWLLRHPRDPHVRYSTDQYIWKPRVNAKAHRQLISHSRLASIRVFEVFPSFFGFIMHLQYVHG